MSTNLSLIWNPRNFKSTKINDSTVSTVFYSINGILIIAWIFNLIDRYCLKMDRYSCKWTEHVWKAYLIWCEILSRFICWFRKFTRKTRKKMVIIVRLREIKEKTSIDKQINTTSIRMTTALDRHLTPIPAITHFDLFGLSSQSRTFTHLPFPRSHAF